MSSKRRRVAEAKGITFKEGREIVIRVKEVAGVSKSTISGYNKLFKDYGKCYGPGKSMNNVTLEDARRFVERQLNGKVQL